MKYPMPGDACSARICPSGTMIPPQSFLAVDLSMSTNIIDEYWTSLDPRTGPKLPVYAGALEPYISSRLDRRVYQLPSTSHSDLIPFSIITVRRFCLV